MTTILNDITVLFLSILAEALPFVLLGSIIASLISLFVSDALLYRLIPKSRIAGLIVASLLGLVFPVCDCTILPVMRRLIRKGLPTSMGVTFMCAVPIVNPAVIFSTWWAFTNQVQVLWMRLFIGIGTAIAAGYIVGKITREQNPLRSTAVSDYNGSKHACGCGHDHDQHHSCSCTSHTEAHNHGEHICSCGHDHEPAQTHSCSSQHSKKHPSPQKRFLHGAGEFMGHTTHEFIDSGALIVIGALLSACIQTLIPHTILYPVAASSAGSVAAMMGFTWVISLCANADAFVAKSFYGIFSIGSVVAFMTFGQMIDLKNTIVMLGFFKKRFVITTILVIALLCFLSGIAINFSGKLQ